MRETSLGVFRETRKLSRFVRVVLVASLVLDFSGIAFGLFYEGVLGISGILAVVAYGLYQGWRSPRLFTEASARLQALSFWGVLVFLLETLLFVLVGQQLPVILAT